MEYITKAVKYLENRGTWLKETTKRVTNKKGKFFNKVSGPVMKVILPLWKIYSQR